MAERKTDPPAPPVPLLEWVAAGLGLALTLAMLGVMLWQGLHGNGDPPAVEARVERIVPTGTGFAAEVALYNRSNATAAQVELEGTLKQGERIVETSAAAVDYVPGESTRRAGLFFTQDPRRHTLDVRVLGYSEP